MSSISQFLLSASDFADTPVDNDQSNVKSMEMTFSSICSNISARDDSAFLASILEGEDDLKSRTLHNNFNSSQQLHQLSDNSGTRKGLFHTASGGLQRNFNGTSPDVSRLSLQHIPSDVTFQSHLVSEAASLSEEVIPIGNIADRESEGLKIRVRQALGLLSGKSENDEEGANPYSDILSVSLPEYQKTVLGDVSVDFFLHVATTPSHNLNGSKNSLHSQAVNTSGLVNADRPPSPTENITPSIYTVAEKRLRMLSQQNLAAGVVTLTADEEEESSSRGADSISSRRNTHLICSKSNFALSHHTEGDELDLEDSSTENVSSAGSSDRPTLLTGEASHSSALSDRKSHQTEGSSARLSRSRTADASALSPSSYARSLLSSRGSFRQGHFEASLSPLPPAAVPAGHSASQQLLTDEIAPTDFMRVFLETEGATANALLPNGGRQPRTIRRANSYKGSVFSQSFVHVGDSKHGAVGNSKDTNSIKNSGDSSKGASEGMAGLVGLLKRQQGSKQANDQEGAMKTLSLPSKTDKSANIKEHPRSIEHSDDEESQNRKQLALVSDLVKSISSSSDPLAKITVELFPPTKYCQSCMRYTCAGCSKRPEELEQLARGGIESDGQACKVTSIPASSAATVIAVSTPSGAPATSSARTNVSGKRPAVGDRTLSPRQKRGNRPAKEKSKPTQYVSHTSAIAQAPIPPMRSLPVAPISHTMPLDAYTGANCGRITFKRPQVLLDSEKGPDGDILSPLRTSSPSPGASPRAASPQRLSSPAKSPSRKSPGKSVDRPSSFYTPLRMERNTGDNGLAVTRTPRSLLPASSSPPSSQSNSISGLRAVSRRRDGAKAAREVDLTGDNLVHSSLSNKGTPSSQSVLRNPGLPGAVGVSISRSASVESLVSLGSLVSEDPSMVLPDTQGGLQARTSPFSQPLTSRSSIQGSPSLPALGRVQDLIAEEDVTVMDVPLHPASSTSSETAPLTAPSSSITSNAPIEEDDDGVEKSLVALSTRFRARLGELQKSIDSAGDITRAGHETAPVQHQEQGRSSSPKEYDDHDEMMARNASSSHASPSHLLSNGSSQGLLSRNSPVALSHTVYDVDQRGQSSTVTVGVSEQTSRSSSPNFSYMINLGGTYAPGSPHTAAPIQNPYNGNSSPTQYRLERSSSPSVIYASASVAGNGNASAGSDAASMRYGLGSSPSPPFPISNNNNNNKATVNNNLLGANNATLSKDPLLQSMFLPTPALHAGGPIARYAVPPNLNPSKSAVVEGRTRTSNLEGNASSKPKAKPKRRPSLTKGTSLTLNSTNNYREPPPKAPQVLGPADLLRQLREGDLSSGPRSKGRSSLHSQGPRASMSDPRASNSPGPYMQYGSQEKEKGLRERSTSVRKAGPSAVQKPSRNTGYGSAVAHERKELEQAAELARLILDQAAAKKTNCRKQKEANDTDSHIAHPKKETDNADSMIVS